jgi:TolB-like protein
MKKFTVFFLCLFMMISVAGSSSAQEIKTIAVLPFSIHSVENIDYVKDGIWDMLISRLSATENIEVIGKSIVAEALKKIGTKDLTIADVYGLGKTLKVDYVVWGSLTKIGNSISLDGKLLDVGTYQSPVGIFEQCRGMDEIIPKIDVFAKKINYQLLGQVPPTFAPPPEPAAVSVPQQQKAAEAPPEGRAIEALKTREGTLTAVINPDFINMARPGGRKGFWMTRRHSVEFRGMDIGDVNGDGSNEVVIIDGTSVRIYRKTGTTLKLLHKISGKSYDNHLTIDVADINGNGMPEIIVTSMQGGTLSSFVLEFQGGKPVRIASDLRWFLRSITTSDGTVLLGQSMGLNRAFENPIYEIRWKGGTYMQGKRMDIPEGLSVYGLTIDTIDRSNRDYIIALGDYDHVRVYKKTKKPLSKIDILGGSDELIWKSDEVFGGSNNFIDFEGGGQKGSTEWADDPGKTYINARILTYDINGDGKKELIIVKNISSSSRLFKNVKTFSKSEIYNLEWDGLGFVENWRTRPINGYVSDYQFKDVDNDGNNEIVLALVLRSGRSTKPKSALVAYDLNGK